ncbi:MAG: hypothetical protein OXF73_09090 [Gammaproteobacteria bacterium]|nr:hypothetical protein [Gammaproteobacteria bacterium]MCY4227025.1 hypothetical protein [Gammaproteobacteria bacterium]
MSLSKTTDAPAATPLNLAFTPEQSDTAGTVWDSLAPNTHKSLSSRIDRSGRIGWQWGIDRCPAIRVLASLL